MRFGRVIVYLIDILKTEEFEYQLIMIGNCDIMAVYDSFLDPNNS